MHPDLCFLDADLLEIASKVVEQLAYKQEDLSQTLEQDGPGEISVANGLKAQYLLLRIALVSTLSSRHG